MNYQRWTATEVDYLTAHKNESDADIGAVLGRAASNIKRKRYELGLLRSRKASNELRRAARAKQPDSWTPAQIEILETTGSNKTSREMKPLIDAAGPPRTLDSIQQKRKSLGIFESHNTKVRRLRAAGSNVDYDARNERLYSNALNRR